MNIIFYKGPEGVFGNAIRLWTWSKYSHCEIEFTPEPYCAHGVRCSALASQGVHWRLPLSEAQAKNWDTVSVPCTTVEEARVREWCQTLIGARYDWAGLFLTQVLPLRFHARSRWFCSELCLAALERLGYFSGRYTTVSPGRLAGMMHL